MCDTRSRRIFSGIWAKENLRRLRNPLERNLLRRAWEGRRRTLTFLMMDDWMCSFLRTAARCIFFEISLPECRKKNRIIVCDSNWLEQNQIAMELALWCK